MKLASWLATTQTNGKNRRNAYDQISVFRKRGNDGVTAPSSGVEAELHNMFKQACESMERKGYKVVCGETVWTQEKAKSASAQNYAQVVGRFRKGGDFQEILELYKSTKRDYCSYKSI
jgi:hypothetical protein